MEQNKEQLEYLADIRSMMDKSSRFLSLSGLSGVSAGIIALIGAAVAFFYLDYDDRYFNMSRYFEDGLYENTLSKLNWLILDGALTLIAAIGFAVLFTAGKAKKQNLPLWSNVAKRMLLALFVPLLAGGIFCVIMIYHRLYYLIAPATLIFYGLALLNASKYTLKDIRYLAVSEIAIGLLACIFIGYGLIGWAVGFGLLHIIYGLVMYFKYERKQV